MKTDNSKTKGSQIPKHSPAPWDVTCQTFTDHSWDVISNGEIVATCGTCQDTSSRIAYNARLISASPDLLNACREALECIREWEEADLLCSTGNVQAILDAAIGKAEGR